MALARYTFLPWLRRGAARGITTAATAASRVEITVSAALNDGTTTHPPIEQVFKLMGPGDVIGIDPDQIVRTEPRGGVTDFEPNYLAFVEFYDEDFCTRYTPAPPADHRLVPWMTLLVLSEDEFARNHGADRPLISVRITAPDAGSFFPPADQLWAWAHVQIAGNVGDAAPDLAALDARLSVSPDSGIARLVSPRRLALNTRYHAFVVPTFEVGRKAGLGLPIDDATESALTPSWLGDPEFPIYYQWSFRTGPGGDFEDLVQRIAPRPVDPRVGVRGMDISAPGFGMPDVPASSSAASDAARVVGLEGALKAPTMTPRPSGPVSEVSEFPRQAAVIVDLPADAQADGVTDPVVAPPLVGGWHALVDRVDPDAMFSWIHALNLDPRLRAAGGLGARVVREHQEHFKKIAWEQVGEVLAANQRAALLRFAQAAAQKSFDKHVRPLSHERTLAFFGPAFSRVRGPSRTIKASLHESRMPDASVSVAFRRITRPRGPFMKRTLPAVERRAGAAIFATAANDQRASAAPHVPRPGGPTVESVTSAVRREAPSMVRLEGLTPATISRQPPQLFALTAPPSRVAVADVRPLRRPRRAVVARESTRRASTDFERAQKDFVKLVSARVAPAPDRPRLDIAGAHAVLMEACAPSSAYPRRAAHLIRIGGKGLTEYVRDAYVDPPVPDQAPHVSTVFAYPDVKDALYAPLRDLSEDLLVPNLSLVPPNTISLMLTNQAFIEAFMAGANHELMRELLWSEYPTDSRGSPLRQFWDVSNVPMHGVDPVARARALKDIKPLHEWTLDRAIGSNANDGRDASSDRVVLVLRGDLLKRYPNTMIYAQRARWSTDPQHPNELALHDELGERALTGVADPHIAYPLFTASVPPDVLFVGFALSLDEVRGDPSLAETVTARMSLAADKLGWFFVLQEAIGEPRLGLDEQAPPANMQSDDRWSNLAWAHVDMTGRHVIDLSVPFVTEPPGDAPAAQQLNWAPADGATAADLAVILNQKPVLVAWHARQMLERGKVD